MTEDVPELPSGGTSGKCSVCGFESLAGSRLRNSWGLRLGAVLDSPGEHPFALDRRLDAGSGGPTVNWNGS